MAETSPMKTSAKENPRTTRVRKIVLDGAIELLIKEGHRTVTPHDHTRHPAEAMTRALDLAITTPVETWPRSCDVRRQDSVDGFQKQSVLVGPLPVDDRAGQAEHRLQSLKTNCRLTAILSA